jgi:hypothetical protein
LGEGSGVGIAEFEGLRHEIMNRITISFTLMALELAALGTGLSVAAKTTQIMVGLAAVSSLLWLYWIDNSIQLQRLGLYIAIELAPRISEIEGRPVLGWEIFFRKLLKGGRDASELLFNTEQARGDKGIALGAGASADWYTLILFGGSTPLLTVLYLVSYVSSKRGADALVWLAAVAVLLVWVFAVSRFINFMRTLRVFSEAIDLHGQLPAHFHDGKHANAANAWRSPDAPVP